MLSRTDYHQCAARQGLPPGRRAHLSTDAYLRTADRAGKHACRRATQRLEGSAEPMEHDQRAEASDGTAGFCGSHVAQGHASREPIVWTEEAAGICLCVDCRATSHITG